VFELSLSISDTPQAAMRVGILLADLETLRSLLDGQP
jgi:hypothetical protein